MLLLKLVHFNVFIFTSYTYTLIQRKKSNLHRLLNPFLSCPFWAIRSPLIVSQAADFQLGLQ